MSGSPTGGFLGKAPPPPAHRLDIPRKTVQLPADLADRIVSERMAPSGPATDFRRNLSVARIEIKDHPMRGLITYELISAWNLENQHAEPLVLDAIEKRRAELKGKTVTITHLYTERIPCSSGRADCQWVLKQKKIPDSRIYYSVEVPDGQLAKKIESHYGPYRRNLPRPPGGGGQGGETKTTSKTPGRNRIRPSPGGKPAGDLTVAVGRSETQAGAESSRVNERAVIDRATSTSQRMVESAEEATGNVGRGAGSKAVPPPSPQPSPK